MAVVNAQKVHATLENISLTKLKKYKITLLVKDGMKVDPLPSMGVKTINVQYNKQYTKDLPNLVNYLEGEKFSSYFDVKSSSINVDNKVKIKFKEIKEGKRNQTPTKVQERGTTVVFNHILTNKKNVLFNTVKELEDDTDLMIKLKDTFTNPKYGGSKKYENNVHDWLVTYYEQQEKFLKEYAPSKWQPFQYNGMSFVKFFEKYIKNFQTYDGTMIKKYTEWNPSDIWAAYDLPGMQKDIKDAFVLDMKQPKKSPPKVKKLNNLLIQMMIDERLVGISLKKIENPSRSHLDLFNVNPKSMKLSAVVNYKWRDLDFVIKNIAEDTKVTTYIKYKNTHEMNINLGDKKKFGNLSFNTQIKDASAQGGQAPVEQVVSLLRSKGSSKDFVNDHNQFPHDIEKYWEGEKKWKQQYEFVKSKTTGLITWSDFDKYITKLYKDKKPQIAASKLMQVSFYNDAFKNYPNDEDFWISLLHLGMKVGNRFAPHAKISD